MSQTYIIVAALIFLTFIYFFQIIFSLKKKREKVMELWNEIAQKFQLRMDKMPYMLELIKKRDEKIFQKAIKLREQSFQKEILPGNCKEHQLKIDKILQELVNVYPKNAPIPERNKFINIKREIIECTNEIRNKIELYNKAAKTFNRLLGIFFFSRIFKIKSVSIFK